MKVEKVGFIELSILLKALKYSMRTVADYILARDPFQNVRVFRTTLAKFSSLIYVTSRNKLVSLF